MRASASRFRLPAAYEHTSREGEEAAFVGGRHADAGGTEVERHPLHSGLPAWLTRRIIAKGSIALARKDGLMASFIGGSAYGMANQIAEGYVLMTAITLKKFQPHEVKLLEAEIDKLAREIRAENPQIDDQQAVQKRNRRLGRINQAMLLVRNYFEQRR